MHRCFAMTFHGTLRFLKMRSERLIGMVCPPSPGTMVQVDEIRAIVNITRLLICVRIESPESGIVVRGTVSIYPGDLSR